MCLSGTLHFPHFLEVCQHGIQSLLVFASIVFTCVKKSGTLLPHVILSHINSESVLPLYCLFFFTRI